MVRNLAAALCLAVAFAASVAEGNADHIYFDCPCTLTSDGTTLTASLGLRSFRTSRSGPMSLIVRAAASRHEGPDSSAPIVATIPLANSVGAGSRLAEASYEGSFAENADLNAERFLLLYLKERGSSATGRLPAHGAAR